MMIFAGKSLWQLVITTAVLAFLTATVDEVLQQAGKASIPASAELPFLVPCRFDAIADLPDDPVDNVAAYPAAAAVTRSSNSSENGQFDNKASASAGYSDTSSYDLLGLFKQQVEQDPAVMVAGLQPQYGFSPFPAIGTVDQGVAAAACTDAGMNMSAFTGAMGVPSGLPVNMVPAAAPAMVMPAAPSSYAPSAMPAVLSMTPAMSAPAPAAPMRKPGSKKTQEEQEAAIERIKQKRRESAQRSRARKNDYMRQLEIENQGLKDEIHRLQSMVQALQRQSYMQQPQQLPTQMAV